MESRHRRRRNTQEVGPAVRGSDGTDPSVTTATSKTESERRQEEKVQRAGRPGGDAWEKLIEIEVMGSRKGGVNQGRGAAARMDTACTSHFIDQYVEAN